MAACGGRFIALIMATAIACGCLLGLNHEAVVADTGCPVAASSFAGGDGSTLSPFQIATPGQLQLLNDDSTIWDDSATFVLTADISLADCTWDSGIGTRLSPFTGTFNGANKAIKDLTVAASESYTTSPYLGAGLFGVISSATIVNLTVTGSVKGEAIGTPGDPEITQAHVGGIVGNASSSVLRNLTFVGSVTAYANDNHPYAGGIVGQGTTSTLEDVNAVADVLATPQGRAAAGGIGGELSTVTVRDSWSAGSVRSSGSAESKVGGIAGSLGSITVERSFSEASITADWALEPSPGGLLGRVQGPVTIKNSYAAGSVKGTTGAAIGGLAAWLNTGQITIENSYARGALTPIGADRLGGLAGRSSNSPVALTNALWDTQSTGTVDAIGATDGGSPSPDVSGATGKTTSAMKAASTFSAEGWSITDGFSASTVWSICPGYNDGYPFLGGLIGSDPCAQPAPTANPSSQTISNVVEAPVLTAPITTSFANPLFSVTPELPSGLTLNRLTGVVSGTAPYAAADRVFTITATSSTLPLQRVTSTISQAATPAPTITPTSQSISGVIGDTVQTIPLVTTGLPSPNFSISPALPPGLTLDRTTGVITGTVDVWVPTPTTYTITAASASTPQTAASTILQAATPAATITPTSQSISGVIGDTVQTIPLVTTGLPSPSFSISPPLPPGLTLDRTTGLITGTVQMRIPSPTTYTITATSASTGQTATSIVTQAASALPPMNPDQISQFPGLFSIDGNLSAIDTRPADGYSLVVAYTTTRLNTTADDTIIGFLLDASGNVVRRPISFIPAGADVPLNTPPSVAFNPVTGGWLACYALRPSGLTDIRCQYLDRDGGATGDSFSVIDALAGASLESAIAYSQADRNFLVAASTSSGPVVRLVDAAAGGPIGSPIPLSTYVTFTGGQGGLAAAADDSGTFGVLQWGRVGATGGQLAPWFFGVGANGTAVAAPSRLIDDTSIAFLQGTTTYDSLRQQYNVVSFPTPGSRPLVARPFSAQGSPVGSSVNTELPAGQFTTARSRPAIAAQRGTSGSLVATTLRLVNSPTAGSLHVMRLDGTGNASAPEYVAGSATNPVGSLPRVAFNAFTCSYNTIFQMRDDTWGYQLYGKSVPSTLPCPAPTVDSVQPISGSAAGGTTVTVAGTNFRAGASVRFGGVAAQVVSVTSTQIVAVTPPGAASTVDVTVTNTDQQSATIQGAFTYSSPSAPAPSFNPAGAPTKVIAEPGNASAVVSWTPPTDEGSYPILGYIVRATPGGRTCSTAATTCTVTGLTNGTSYTFTVTASSAGGDGLTSAPSAPVTPRTTPGWPTGVTVKPGDGRATITWSPPSTDGGSPITGYRVTTIPTSEGCTVTATSCTLDGLANGKEYVVSVVATNIAGSSAPATAAVTPRGKASIVITGTRGRNDPSLVKILGTVTNLEVATVQPYIRLGRAQEFQPSLTQATVGDEGRFRWQRITSKRVTVYVEAAGTVSNRVTLPAR